MPSADATFNSLSAAQPDDYHSARLTVLKAPHSGDWLNALPITSCGLCMEDDNIRVVVGLCLGTSLCEPHQCTYGNMVNTRGNHGLSCKMSAGRTLRYNYLNDLFTMLYYKQDCHRPKNLQGYLISTDGKQPDSLTNVP